MATLREVTTRFKFETDEAGVRKFNSRIGAMKRSLGKFAKLGLLGLGVSAFTGFNSMVQSAEQARFSLRRLVGTNFKPLRKKFHQIQDEIRKVSNGIAGGFVIETDFDVSAVNFFSVLNRGKREMSDFIKIFRFANKESELTGKNVVQIVDTIQSAIQGGSLEGLLSLPNFDIFKKQFEEFILGEINPNEPGGRATIEQRRTRILEILSKAQVEQNASLKKLTPALTASRETGSLLKDTLIDLGSTMRNLLAPVLLKLNDFLKLVNGRLIQFTKGDGVKDVRSLIIGAITGFNTPVDNKTIEERERVKALSFFEGVEHFKKQREAFLSKGKQTTTLTIHNSILIQRKEDEGLAKIISNAIKSKFDEAKDNLIRTEDNRLNN